MLRTKAIGTLSTNGPKSLCLGAADLPEVAGGHTEQAPHRGSEGKLRLQLPCPVHHSEMSPDLAASDFGNRKKKTVNSASVEKLSIPKWEMLSQLT